MLNILDYIPTGEVNAITSRELASLCGFKSVRDLQTQIEILRGQGFVICSTSKAPGCYFIHETEHELRAFVRTLNNRAMHTLRSLESAKQALDDLCNA